MPGLQGGGVEISRAGCGVVVVVGFELRKVMGRKDDPGGRSALTRAV